MDTATNKDMNTETDTDMDIEILFLDIYRALQSPPIYELPVIHHGPRSNDAKV